MSLLSELTKTAARHGVAKKSVGSGVLGTVAGLIATRIATKSVPGAVLVGGAILGKYLWDKKKERDARDASNPRTVAEPDSAPTTAPYPHAKDAIIDQ